MMVKIMLAAAILGWTLAAAGRAFAQGTPDLPARRPEEAQVDPMQSFDVNKNGTLELAEVKSAAAARFDELNPDGDDTLDEREAALVLRGEAFRTVAADKDGTVGKAEYLAYVEQMFVAANSDKLTREPVVPFSVTLLWSR